MKVKNMFKKSLFGGFNVGDSVSRVNFDEKKAVLQEENAKSFYANQFHTIRNLV